MTIETRYINKLLQTRDNMLGAMSERGAGVWTFKTTDLDDDVRDSIQRLAEAWGVAVVLDGEGTPYAIEKNEVPAWTHMLQEDTLATATLWLMMKMNELPKGLYNQEDKDKLLDLAHDLIMHEIKDPIEFLKDSKFEYVPGILDVVVEHDFIDRCVSWLTHAETDIDEMLDVCKALILYYVPRPHWYNIFIV